MSADGRSALSSNDRTVKLWDLASGGVLRTFEGHAGRFNSVSMSADGKSALSGFDDTTVKLWDLVSGGVLRTFEGHTGRVMSVAMRRKW